MPEKLKPEKLRIVIDKAAIRDSYLWRIFWVFKIFENNSEWKLDEF